MASDPATPLLPLVHQHSSAKDHPDSFSGKKRERTEVDPATATVVDDMRLPEAKRPKRADVKNGIRVLDQNITAMTIERQRLIGYSQLFCAIDTCEEFGTMPCVIIGCNSVFCRGHWNEKGVLAAHVQAKHLSRHQ